MNANVTYSNALAPLVRLFMNCLNVSVVRVESPHPNNAFLFEWHNGENEQPGTSRDNFYAPANGRVIAPNALQQNPGPSNASVENTDNVLPSNQGGDRRFHRENARDAGAATVTLTRTGGNASGSGPPFFECAESNF